MGGETVRLYRGETFIAQAAADAAGRHRFSVDTTGWPAGPLDLRATAEDVPHGLPVSDAGFMAVTAKGPHWQDTFERANGLAPEWVYGLAYTDCHANISGNALVTAGWGGFGIVKQHLPETVPPDFYMHLTIPHSMVTKNFWWVFPRYREAGGGYFGPRFGRDNAAFSINDGEIIVTPPASWAIDQNHTITFHMWGPLMKVYLDLQYAGESAGRPDAGSVWGPTIALTGEAGFTVLDMALNATPPVGLVEV